ncbi:hypothetical protein ARALYDRAFT_337527 [Arabidopsis lyrata subsp. lyrata]|uniref:Uncharacterized protein n=1 Tax=Arabidopsis lyrata subsp. lyrata TaxID=81972 RepID=D7KL96_ARALL|nr:hypothetical protein ARALYDRAFT_337527 [Arabidopsis lyrata subsp. lyrata]
MDAFVIVIIIVCACIVLPLFILCCVLTHIKKKPSVSQPPDLETGKTGTKDGGLVVLTGNDATTSVVTAAVITADPGGGSGCCCRCDDGGGGGDGGGCGGCGGCGASSPSFCRDWPGFGCGSPSRPVSLVVVFGGSLSRGLGGSRLRCRRCLGLLEDGVESGKLLRRLLLVSSPSRVGFSESGCGFVELGWVCFFSSRRDSCPDLTFRWWRNPRLVVCGGCWRGLPHRRVSSRLFVWVVGDAWFALRSAPVALSNPWEMVPVAPRSGMMVRGGFSGCP